MGRGGEEQEWTVYLYLQSESLFSLFSLCLEERRPRWSLPLGAAADIFLTSAFEMAILCRTRKMENLALTADTVQGHTSPVQVWVCSCRPRGADSLTSAVQQEKHFNET